MGHKLIGDFMATYDNTLKVARVLGLVIDFSNQCLDILSETTDKVFFLSYISLLLFFIRDDSPSHSLLKLLTLLLLFKHDHLILLNECPIELSNDCVFESDILLLPCLNIGRGPPHCVPPAVLLRIEVTNDDVLLPESLVATDTVLVVPLDLPVLVRIKLKKVVDFIVSLIVVAVLREYLESPLGNLHFLCRDTILDLTWSICLDFFNCLSKLFLLESHLAMIGMPKVRVLLHLF